MPSTNTRKDSPTAHKRFLEKYIQADAKSNPYNMYPPNKEDTEALRKLMGTRNYIRILTQLDKNKYIVLQYWIYAEPDFWLCGDSLTFNQNPDKKIWAKVMCSARKAPCICDNEESNEFLTVCPNCRKLVVMIKNTPFKCKTCEFILNHIDVNSMPYAKIICEWCPRECGWDKAQTIRELVQQKLVLRSVEAIKMKNREQVKDIKDLLNGFKKIITDGETDEVQKEV
jgi:hypothetical protein